jgi:hypothetical protein
MTQVAGQRGPQPLHYASRSKHPKGEQTALAKPNSGRPATNVKFGGGADRLVNASLSGLAKVVPVSIFEKITEVFLVGFLAQDMIAMWLPRVGTSLKVGREPYDPQQDPQAKGLPFHEQIKKWLIGNYKGLNWVNFNEETKREFATGPGLLSVPALAFVLNRYMGNRARELSFHSLKDLGEGFSEHLAKLAEKGEKFASVAEQKKAVQSYIQDLFVDPNLQAEEKAFLQDWSKKWTEALFEQESKSKGARWLESTKRFFSKSPPVDLKNPKTLDDLAEQLSEKIRDFNRGTDYKRMLAGERMMAYDVRELGVLVDHAPLHHAEQTWIAYRPNQFNTAFNKAKDNKAMVQKARELVDQKSVGHLTGDLNRFGSYVKAVFNKYENSGGKTAISEVAEKTMQHLAGSKLLLGVGTTVLTSLYLLKLAFWAQNHDSYQAVRLLKHDNGAKKGTQPMQQAQQQSLLGTPVQAGLPFGAQPASMYPGSVLGGSFRAPAPPMMNAFARPMPMGNAPMTFRAANPQQSGWRNA